MSSEYHIEIPYMKPTVHGKHPFNNANTHEFLLQYLRERLRVGKEVRDGELDRMILIDKHVAGWMRMSESDRLRQAKEERDGTPQAVTVNLPLTFVHLDDMMTYYAATFAPNRGMFYSTAKPDEQSATNAITTIMNNHAIYAGYYRHTLQALWNILKYNNGGILNEWATDSGPKFSGQGANVEVEETVVWSGNRVESLDMYNTFHDPYVEPSEVHAKGEWAARAKLISRFELQMKANRGYYFNVEQALLRDGLPECQYYRKPPREAHMEADDSKGSKTNWVNILSMTDGYMQTSGFEIVDIYIKLNPYQLNLIPRNATNRQRNRIELWKITLLNDMHIIACEPLKNVHGHIPTYFGRINDDLMEKAQKSVAEILKPLQNFASFLLNPHIQATRQNIWGLTIYDKNVVDLEAMPKGEVAAMIATKPMAAGKRIQDYIWTHSNTLETKQTMQDLESTMGIINQFFPTQSLPSQIAGIDRAVNSQVLAVQQGANRRMQKGARLLDDLMFRPMRFGMYYNILQYHTGGSVSDFYGKKVEVNLDELRQTDLPFIIGQGLKAIDRMGLADAYQSLIFALIQTPQAGQQFDLAQMINVWGNLVDMDIDMTQFRIQQPEATNLGPDGQPIAPVNAEGAAGIQPATNPANITAPIYG